MASPIKIGTNGLTVKIIKNNTLAVILSLSTHPKKNRMA